MLKKYIKYSLLLIIFLFSLTMPSCGSPESAFYGTWYLESVTENDAEYTLSEWRSHCNGNLKSHVYFDSDGSFELYIRNYAEHIHSNGTWEFDENEYNDNGSLVAIADSDEFGNIVFFYEDSNNECTYPRISIYTEKGNNYLIETYSQNNDYSSNDESSGEFDLDNVEMLSIDSTCFCEVGYDQNFEKLLLSFRNNPEVLYIYEDISQELFDNFMSSESLGSFYNDYIKGIYICERLD